MPRSSVAAALLAAVLTAPAAAAPEAFPPLIADPRETQLSASYDRRDGENDSDVALGHAWGLTRWRSGILQEWLWELDLEAMAYSRFRIDGRSSDLETGDLFANLPLTARRGAVSFKAMLFHENSYRPDRYSVEGLRGLAAFEPASFLRLYGGGAYLIRTVPDPRRWAAQSGVELTTGDLRWSTRAQTRLFVAEDVQSHENVRWNVNSSTTAGVRINLPESPRAVRLQVGYFTGHSPFGEFYRQKDRYADVAIAFDL